MTMNCSMTKQAIAMTIAGAIVFGAATPLWAAPALLNPGAVKAAATTDLIDIRYRGRGYGPAIGAAVALGIVGAAIASHQGYGPAYYGHGPGYYDQGYYGEPGYAPAPYAYGPAPYAYGPRYGNGRCAGEERY